MPNQCLYNKLVISSPWVLTNGHEEQTLRLHQQSQLSIVDTSLDMSSAEYSILNLEQWQSSEQRCKSCVLLVHGHEEIETIHSVLKSSGAMPGLVLIDFPVFSDGRGYSLARLLKREAWFTSELGAIGDVLQDQIFFYWRCGFDVMVPRHDQDIQACKNALHSFSHAYQPAERQPGHS